MSVTSAAGLQRSLGGSAAPCVRLSPQEEAGAGPDPWHSTSAGSEVAEMSTERQADTHAALTLPWAPSSLSHLAAGALARSASARDALGVGIC